MADPTGCAIPGNDWSAFVPGPSAEWSPTRTVSICIPARDPGRGLERTLKCLAAQTYPHELIEVVIADDGSDHGFDAPVGLPFDVRVVPLERTLDFGAGRARNAAAGAADGQILLFLDGDVIPERQVVESYARWFDSCDLVVPMGLCRFVDVADVGDDDLVELIRRGRMARHFAGADVDDQNWREVHFGRTRDLRDERFDLFRVMIGATLAVDARHFRTVGGFPELGVRGVEDTAFGYRVFNEGGILLLDRDAVHWHQGRRSIGDDATRARINEVRAPYVASVMPVSGFRNGEPPSDPPTEVAPVARVHLRGRPDECDRARQRLDALATGNVAVGEAPFADPDSALVQVDLPADVRWGATTVERIHELLRERPVGVIRALVEGSDGDAVTIARTRALRRAAHVAPERDPVEVAAELFGSWWVTGASLGFASPHVSGAPVVDGSPVVAGVDDDRVPLAARLFDTVVALLRAATR